MIASQSVKNYIIPLVGRRRRRLRRIFPWIRIRKFVFVLTLHSNKVVTHFNGRVQANCVSTESRRLFNETKSFVCAINRPSTIFSFTSPANRIDSNQISIVFGQRCSSNVGVDVCVRAPVDRLRTRERSSVSAVQHKLFLDLIWVELVLFGIELNRVWDTSINFWFLHKSFADNKNIIIQPRAEGNRRRQQHDPRNMAKQTVLLLYIYCEGILAKSRHLI